MVKIEAFKHEKSGQIFETEKEYNNFSEKYEITVVRKLEREKQEKKLGTELLGLEKEAVKLLKESQERIKRKDNYINSHAKMKEINNMISNNKTQVKKLELHTNLCKASLQSYRKEIAKEFDTKIESPKIISNKRNSISRKTNNIYNKLHLIKYGKPR